MSWRNYRLHYNCNFIFSPDEESAIKHDGKLTLLYSMSNQKVTNYNLRQWLAIVTRGLSARSR